MRWNGASHCEYDGKSMETETITWSEFPNGGKVIVELILEWEQRKKSKRNLRVTVKGLGKLTIWVRPFETEKLPGLSDPTE